jgi:hypothetical protein
MHSQVPTDGKTFSCPGGTNYQVVFCPPSNASLTKNEGLPPIVIPTSTINGTFPVTVSPQLARPNQITINGSFPVTLSPQPAPASQTANSSPSPAAARARSSSKRQVIIVFLAIIGGFIFLSVLSLALFFICKQGRWHRAIEETEEFGELQGTPMRFTFQQLKVATDDFRDKLGEGGFGTVFKAQIGEEIIAVKRLDRTGQGKREFLAEVLTIGGIHHINLVRLIGFCAEKSHRLLVYEFMPKGSLDKWIYYRQGNTPFPLDWEMRCKIITHVAKGLCYLHEECSKRIAHLDVKPQNILLDDNFNAKLSDFGLCKLIDRDKSEVITRMRCTSGYLAPEWLTSQLTEKADIYSSRSEESVHLITLFEKKGDEWSIIRRFG